MANNGYKIICFEQGAKPVLKEQLSVYNEYSYMELMSKIVPAVRNNEYDQIYSSICGEKKLVLKNMEQVDGRQATIEIMNHIHKERVKQKNITILIGQYIVDELLANIPEDLIFCTNKTE